jgi:hypothetical protein
MRPGAAADRVITQLSNVLLASPVRHRTIDAVIYRVAFASASGIILGVALFVITAGSVSRGLGWVGPCIVPANGTVKVEMEHFDPWTGQPRPRTDVCDADGPGPIPPETHEVNLLRGHAFPVPVGAALGFGLAWAGLAGFEFFSRRLSSHLE